MNGDEQRKVYVAQMESPIGPLLLAATEKGLCLIEFGSLDDPDVLERVKGWLRRWLGDCQMEQNELRLAVYTRQLAEYFAGSRRAFDVPLEMLGTPFQKQVWQALTAIPYGETRSYKQLAEAIGRTKGFRAVGGANNCNPISVIVPCHRVIGANGGLVGYGGGLAIKQYLLNLENGVTS